MSQQAHEHFVMVFAGPPGRPLVEQRLCCGHQVCALRMRAFHCSEECSSSVCSRHFFAPQLARVSAISAKRVCHVWSCC